MSQLLATIEIPQLRSWKHKNLRQIGTIKTKHEERHKIRTHQILQENQAWPLWLREGTQTPGCRCDRRFQMRVITKTILKSISGLFCKKLTASCVTRVKMGWQMCLTWDQDQGAVWHCDGPTPCPRDLCRAVRRERLCRANTEHWPHLCITHHTPQSLFLSSTALHKGEKQENSPMNEKISFPKKERKGERPCSKPAASFWYKTSFSLFFFSQRERERAI